MNTILNLPVSTYFDRSFPANHKCTSKSRSVKVLTKLSTRNGLSLSGYLNKTCALKNSLLLEEKNNLVEMNWTLTLTR